MSSFQLDNDGDLLVTNNELTLTTGREAIRQHIQTSYRLFFGEWFLDIGIGVPYFETVFQKQANFVAVQQVLKSVVINTPGVIGLLSFLFDYFPTTREADVEFVANTEEGILDFRDFLIIQ